MRPKLLFGVEPMPTNVANYYSTSRRKSCQKLFSSNKTYLFDIGHEKIYLFSRNFTCELKYPDVDFS